jgi:hypothetical protein
MGYLGIESARVFGLCMQNLSLFCAMLVLVVRSRVLGSGGN